MDQDKTVQVEVVGERGVDKIKDDAGIDVGVTR